MKERSLKARRPVATASFGGDCSILRGVGTPDEEALLASEGRREMIGGAGSYTPFMLSYMLKRLWSPQPFGIFL